MMQHTTARLGRSALIAGLVLVGSAAPLGAVQVSAQQEPEVVLRRQPIRGGLYGPELRQALLDLGGDLSGLDGLPLTSSSNLGGSGSLDLMTLFIPATGITETYLFYTPPAPPTPAPLLVHFHQASTSAYDLVVLTTFLDEAEARNWYVIAPFQLVPTYGTNHFSSVNSQLHVDAVINWALANHAIDLDRIYGYGFSMGGGAALNYAARHLDRERGTFAALVNHTGTLSLVDEYERALSPAILRPILVGLFGGTPTQRRFEYLRSSILDLQASGTLALRGEHTAVNLAHIPIQSWFATGDPQAHLVAQARQLDVLFSRLPGAKHQLVPVSGTQHTWATLDEQAICDWFDLQRLARVKGGELRLDRSGKYHSLNVTVGQIDRFAHLFHDARPERLSITRSVNVEEVRVAAAEAGLDPGRVPFEVLVNTTDGSPDRVLITGFTRAPGAVLRDGAPAVSGWTYNGGSQTLTVEAPDGRTHLWSVQ